MSNRVQKVRKPYQLPQWLVDASKKRSGVPAPPVDQAFLNKLQHARTHADDVERKAREDAIRSGRDPDAFAKMIAETRKHVSQVRLAERPKQVHTEEAVEYTGPTAESVELVRPERNTTPSSVVSTPPATESMDDHVPSSPRAQRRVLAKAPTTGRPHADVRDERRGKKEKAKRKTKHDRTSSASGTASPMELDSPQPAAESSAPGAVTTSAQTLSNAPAIVAHSYPYPTRTSMPKWYIAISATAQGLAQLDRKRPQEIAAIDALKNRITRCEQEKDRIRLNKEYNELRNEVHKAEIRLNMDKFKVKKTRILAESGLPRIFGKDAKFPWDLKADAWYLYERWMNEDFEQNILRGIVTVKGKDRNGDRLDSAYKEKHPKDPKFFGDEGVVLGQWWPSQLCTVRDGVHGAAQGGIYGDKDKGAYSIVLSGGGYHDQDEGDIIEYSGTDGKEFQATDATLSMIKSAELGNHIRVIRSSQLKKANKYRPSCGLRYDGLYQIKSYKELDNEKRTYRFHLERLHGQKPIRFAGVTKRPTVFEEEAYDKCKGKI